MALTKVWCVDGYCKLYADKLRVPVSQDSGRIGLHAPYHSVRGVETPMLAEIFTKFGSDDLNVDNVMSGRPRAFRSVPSGPKQVGRLTDS
jgi:hypothetical protein